MIGPHTEVGKDAVEEERKKVLTINDSCVGLARRHRDYVMLAQWLYCTEGALVGNVIGDLMEKKRGMTETDNRKPVLLQSSALCHKTLLVLYSRPVKFFI